MDGPKLEDIRKIRVLNFIPPPPPSVLKDFGGKQPRRKKAIENEQNAQLLKVLVTTHIPFLETSLQAKHNECAQLTHILRCRDETIARKDIMSRMKNDEMQSLRNENLFLKREMHELRIKQQEELEQWADIEKQMEVIHEETNLCLLLEDKPIEVQPLKADDTATISLIHMENEEIKLQPLEVGDTAKRDDEALELQPLENDDDAIMANTAAEISTEHNYFSKKIPTNSVLKYKCEDCGYSTDRKNTLSNHRAETCKVRRRNGLLAAKNKQCKYCNKAMRHNSLRAHLRHFIKALKGNRSPKGKHAGIKLEEFERYLDQIKEK